MEETLKAMLQLIAQYGFPVVVAMYFLWRDLSRERVSAKREERLAGRLTEMEDRLNDLLTTTIKENTAALGELAKRPCLLPPTASGHHVVVPKAARGV